ncbi:VTT domain-containing protein [Legionella sp. W05-934-2]|jgi:membrane protein DedA with SNARE-associated domain|uniref:VTT domain-containing protein n=1 Tax=Legionella sp. W05-934-2 TaxID=1198649 RepID=UPI003461CF53
MHLFTDYIQPITVWLADNPHWALIITFLISFSESLAIVGSIVPGSVTMTAIGILAGSGVMRIDLTILAAILGATCGDSASYFLGYYYSDRLAYVWPFSKYPKWLAYGKDYFTKHGGKSVLIGRFIGPLRSLIPIIAGMMKMQQSRFLTANVLSAIGWSILYVIPGVLIGAASSELSNESATKLFVGVLLALFAIWIAGIGLKWLLIHSKIWLSHSFHRFWIFAKRHRRVQSIFLWITPPAEKDHAPTCFLLLSILIILISLFFINLFQSSPMLNGLDQGIYYFFSSIKNSYFDTFLIITALLTSFYITVYFYLILATGFLLHKQWRTLRYWFFIPILTLLINLCGCQNISQPLLYPVFHLSTCLQQSWITSLCSSVLLFTNYGYKQMHAGLTTVLFIVFVGFSALTHLYFAQLSFTDILIASLNGLLVATILWLFYRRKHLPLNTDIKPWVSFYALIIISFAIAFSFLEFPQLKETHPFKQKISLITKNQWWNQQGFTPPQIRRNRWGTPVSYMNIQFAGDLEVFRLALQSQGWQAVDDHIFQAFLGRLKANDSWYRKLPFLPQLYKAKSSKLVMVKQVQGDFLVIRLWLSPIELKHDKTTIYFGSVHQSYLEQKQHHISQLSPIAIVRHDLNGLFKLKPFTLMKQSPPILVNMPNDGLLISQ